MNGIHANVVSGQQFSKTTNVQVLTPSVRRLVTSTLVGDEPAPDFVDGVPAGANKVVVACVSGLGMAKAEMSMAAGVRRYTNGIYRAAALQTLKKGVGGNFGEGQSSTHLHLRQEGGVNYRCWAMTWGLRPHDSYE